MARTALLPHPNSAIADGDSGFIGQTWFKSLRDAYDLLPKSGTVTFAAATTAAVTFDKAERDTNYTILTEAPENRTVWITAKTTTGFTMNVSAASSATYNWVLVRN